MPCGSLCELGTVRDDEASSRAMTRLREKVPMGVYKRAPDARERTIDKLNCS